MLPRINVLLCAWIFVLTGSERLALAQAERSKLAPELAPLAAKYDAEIAALTRAHEQALEPIRKAYLNLLATAEQQVTSVGNPDALKAIVTEKEALTTGPTIDQTPSPLLPQQLIKPRTTYLRELARIDRSHAQIAQKPTTDYLRALAFLEAKARGSKQTDLVEQIRTEKLRISGQAASNSGPVQNTLVVNGDFSQKNANDLPDKWSVNGPGKAAATMEDGMPFLRLLSPSKTETWLRQPIKRPPGAKELRVQLRVRCRDFKSGGGYGIVLAQFDSAATWRSGTEVCWSDSRVPSWKELRGVVTLQPDTAEIVIRCNIKDAIATVDFADVRVSAH